MKDDAERFTAIPGGEERAVVRLILQNDEGEVLMARYKATAAEVVEERGQEPLGRSLPTYWSFKGLPNLRLYGNESWFEAMVRTAYTELGITIEDFDLISSLYVKNVTPRRLGRLYVLVHRWSGTLPIYVEKPDAFKMFEGLHNWTPRDMLGSYLHHEEVKHAHAAWKSWQKERGARA